MAKTRAMKRLLAHKAANPKKSRRPADDEGPVNPPSTGPGAAADQGDEQDTDQSGGAASDDDDEDED